jgi:glutathione S-transferase
MKVFYSATSPFVRKCLVCAHELGLLGYLEFRFATLGWREKYPDTAVWFDRFAKRDSMMATRAPAS